MGHFVVVVAVVVVVVVVGCGGGGVVVVVSSGVVVAHASHGAEQIIPLIRSSLHELARPSHARTQGQQH